MCQDSTVSLRSFLSKKKKKKVSFFEQYFLPSLSYLARFHPPFNLNKIKAYDKNVCGDHLFIVVILGKGNEDQGE